MWEEKSRWLKFEQVQYRYSTGTVQVQYRYSTGTVQVQYRYSTGTVPVVTNGKTTIRLGLK